MEKREVVDLADAARRVASVKAWSEDADLSFGLWSWCAGQQI